MGIVKPPLVSLKGSTKPGQLQYPPVPKRALKRELPSPTGAKLVPAEVFSTLQAARPADAVLLIESTSNVEEFHKWVPITRPHSFSLFASGGLGWALPAAVGFALAERDTGRNRPVLCILGDGATTYSIQALYTAAQHRLPVVFLVLNNQEYGILRAFADQQKTPGVPGIDLPDLDFVSLATGYGCTAVRGVTSGDLAQALQDALRRPGPTVLDISITSAVAPFCSTSNDTRAAVRACARGQSNTLPGG